MLAKLVNKAVLIQKPVLRNILIFLVKVYLKPVLGNLREKSHCKVDLYNVHIELHKCYEFLRLRVKLKEQPWIHKRTQ